MTKTPIGQLKTKKTVYCDICGCKHIRNLKIDIYENTPQEIEKAKIKLSSRANAKYTCKVCKYIRFKNNIELLK